MQRLTISHLTEYRYAVPVTLGPHQLLLRPREGHDVRIESSKLDIAPVAQIKWHRDVFDNSVAVASFTEPADRLTIASEVVIEHSEEAPLDFVVADYAVNHPFLYSPEERIELLPYEQPAYPNEQDALRDWVSGFGFGRGPIETYALLDRMNRALAEQFTYLKREEPGVQPPTRTLAERNGSCRDYAALFIEACRYLGLASRFVSGYLHAPATEAGNAATHAWAEVYLQGPGWKGFDPTLDEIAGARHIAVAVARHPGNGAPGRRRLYGSGRRLADPRGRCAHAETLERDSSGPDAGRRREPPAAFIRRANEFAPAKPSTGREVRGAGFIRP